MYIKVTKNHKARSIDSKFQLLIPALPLLPSHGEIQYGVHTLIWTVTPNSHQLGFNSHYHYFLHILCNLDGWIARIYQIKSYMVMFLV